MSLKWRYFGYILLLHIGLGVLAFLVLEETKVLFLGVEVLILVSLGIAYALYRRFTRPLRLLGSGIDAIKDQDFAIQLRPTGSPDMDRLVQVYNEMMKNIRKERAQVQQQDHFLNQLIEASPAGIVLMDYDGQITEINPHGLQMLGLREVPLSQKPEATGHPLLQELAGWEAGQSGVIAGKGQERFHCEVAHFIHRGFHRKFILLRELSREMLAAEKRAYGKVIRMMAHEVNNSIGAINSILQSTLEAYPDHPEDELADDIRASLEVAWQRNERLNQFMRNFAEVVRLPAPDRRRIALDEVLRNVQQLMAPQAERQQTAMRLMLPEQSVYFEADERQLEQALVNMVKNALEALEQGGEVQLRLLRHPLSLVVADNGPGLPPELADNRTTPFFSTKPAGQGIGLTLVREIARQHGGHYELERVEEGWTECRMVLA